MLWGGFATQREQAPSPQGQGHKSKDQGQGYKKQSHKSKDTRAGPQKHGTALFQQEQQ
jgi:hypothetical protein